MAEGSPGAAGRLLTRLLVLVLLWSAALRFYNIHAFASAHYNWDEMSVVRPARRAMDSGQWHPETFLWPALAPYWAAAVLLGTRAVSDVWASRTGAPLFDFRGAAGVPAAPIVISRVAMALAGLFTVLLAYWIGRRLYGRAAGLLAAAWLGGSQLHVTKSQEATPDVVLTCMASLAVLLALRTEERPSWGRYVLAGTGIGLTVAAKYNGWPVCLVLVVVALGSLPLRAALPRLAVAGLVSVAVFFLTNPYTLVHWKGFLQQLRGLRHLYRRKGAKRGISRADMFRTSWHVSTQLLLGLVPTVLALHGILAAFARRRAGEAGVALFVLAYLLWYNLALRLPQAHNYLIVAPCLGVLAAGVAVRAFRRLAAGTAVGRPAWRRPCGIAAALLLTVPGFLSTSLHQRRERTLTTRHIVQGWTERQVESGARVGVEGVAFRKPARGIRALPLRAAVAEPPARLDYALVDLEEVRASASRFPARRAGYEELLLGGDTRVAGILKPGGFWLPGPPFALLRWSRGPWVVVEDEAVPLERFELVGEGARDADHVWVRSPGSTAMAELLLGGGPGESVEVEVQAGSDDWLLEVRGDLMGLWLEVDGAGTAVEVACDRLGSYRSARFELGPPPHRIALRYVGGAGGRVYLSEVRVRRLAPRGSLPRDTVLRRARELRLVEEAGLGPLDGEGEPP